MIDVTPDILCDDCGHPKATHFLNDDICVYRISGEQCGCTNVFEYDENLFEK